MKYASNSSFQATAKSNLSTKIPKIQGFSSESKKTKRKEDNIILNEIAQNMSFEMRPNKMMIMKSLVKNRRGSRLHFKINFSFS